MHLPLSVFFIIKIYASALPVVVKLFLHMVFCRRVPPFAERGTDRRVQCRDLETLPQMGRRAHRRHPECEGPSFFAGDREHSGKQRLHQLLNQASGDRKILSERLNLSADQQKYIDNSEPGEGLLIFENVGRWTAVCK